MTTEELANLVINSSPNDFQKMSDDDLKELKEFLQEKAVEVNWHLRGRARAKRASNSKL